MKKRRNIFILSITLIVIALLIGILIYNVFIDENALSISEMKWIDNNKSTVVSITIPNDIPVFGTTGEGVFFDFIDYLKKQTSLEINKNMASYLSSNDGYRFEITNNYERDSLLLYKDHYVLVSKNTGLINDTTLIPQLGVGVVSNTLAQVTAYFDCLEDKFVSFENYSSITEALSNGTIYYALVPLNEYKDELVANNINVLTHVSDLNKYYYLKLSGNEVLNSILSKEFNRFMSIEYDKSYNKNNYKLFIDCLNITEAEEDTLTNKVYRYGFAEYKPYEVLASSQYGGITAQYLQKFSEFSDVDFTYKKYKTSSELAKAAIRGEVDLYYNYYNIVTNYIDCGALNNINFYVIASNTIDLSMTNINGIANRDVYVLKNSYLYDYIKDIEGINIITYEKSSELKSLAKKENIIVIDEYQYDYYVNKIASNYSVRYKGTLEDNHYIFKYVNETDSFYKLFSAYTKTIDPLDLLRNGITTYNKVERSGEIVGSIAKAILISIVFALALVILIQRNSKNIKLNTKVKKEDRLKYIDLLTSLKNRNYYNEKLPVWNKNTIYPQTCIVLDINNVKELNDTLGYQEGDKQIQAVANVLIKTQLDNSEIIRTDGNEFLVYLIGYSEKQILTYMKKLVKEFKKLPHENGVAMGFSMIEDDTKLVDDAFNEASIQMRENKELEEDNDD
ncbi:MAG: diguanylate cyclase [Erysipelotrichales bacterium]|nr:diguanylate cyclase [Erysipelotrichales bacterium]